MSSETLSKLNVQIAREDLEDGKVKLTLTLPASKTADLVKGSTFVLALQNKIDLEKVKVEDFDAVVIEAVGEDEYKQFINQYAMNALTPYAIEDEHIDPIMEPVFSYEKEIVPGEDFVFSAKITPKPQYELSSYGPVEVKLPAISVNQEEIDAQLQRLAKQSVKTEVDTEALVAPDSEVVFAIHTFFKESNEPVDHLTAERRFYTLSEDFLPEEFDEALVGMAAGESRSFEFDMPGMENMDGTPGPTRRVKTTVDLIQVNRRVIPALDDAWVSTHFTEAGDLEGLRNLLREEGMKFKREEQEVSVPFLAASALAERLIGSIPDEIYEFTRDEMLASLGEQLKESNMSLEEYAKSLGLEQQQFNMNFMMEVRENLRQNFSLDALARHLELTVDEDDIQYALKEMAPGNEQKAQAEFEGTGRSYVLKEASLRAKAHRWLVDTAVIKYAN